MARSTSGASSESREAFALEALTESNTPGRKPERYWATEAMRHVMVTPCFTVGLLGGGFGGNRGGGGKEKPSPTPITPHAETPCESFPRRVTRSTRAVIDRPSRGRRGRCSRDVSLMAQGGIAALPMTSLTVHSQACRAEVLVLSHLFYGSDMASGCLRPGYSGISTSRGCLRGGGLGTHEERTQSRRNPLPTPCRNPGVLLSTASTASIRWRGRSAGPPEAYLASVCGVEQPAAVVPSRHRERPSVTHRKNPPILEK